MTTSPSTASGVSSVAWKVWPCWLVSESMVSTSLTARVVPEGIVTFFGGGGGGGVEGATATGAVGAIAATGGAEFVSPDEEGRLRRRGSCRRALGAGAGEGLLSSTGGGVVSAVSAGGGAATCRLLTICLTPGSEEA